jgi:hypothetical protein
MFNSKRKTEGVKFHATDPKGNHKAVYFSYKKYSAKDIERMGDEWVSAVRAGLEPPKWKFVLKKEGTEDNKSDSSSDSDSDSDDDTKFETKPFELSLPDRKFGCSMLFCGSTRSGKSTAIDYIYKKYFSKDYITVLHSQSLHAEAYDEIRKKVVGCPQYMPQLIEETHQINSKTENHYEFLHILDDVVNAKNDKTIQKALTIGRNARQTIAISAQDLTMFNSIGRGNINFVMLFKLNSDMAIEKVVRSYLQSWFPAHMKIRDMIREYKKLTQDHQFFLIDNLKDQICLTKINLNE